MTVGTMHGIYWTVLKYWSEANTLIKNIHDLIIIRGSICFDLLINIRLPFVSNPKNESFINTTAHIMAPTNQYGLISVFSSVYAGINFIQNHPPPRDTTRREQKPSPRDNNCVQKPFPRDKTGSQKPHPRDIKLENSDTISNEKLCRLNK